MIKASDFLRVGVLGLTAFGLAACVTTSKDGEGAASSGANTSLVGAAGIECVNPFSDTYECFDGQLLHVVAGDPSVIGTYPVQASPNRPPKTLSFGKSRGDSAPIDPAGRQVHAPKLKAYAEDILAKLLEVAPVEPPAIAVHIVSDPFYGGFATGENDIFINLGTFNEANTEDEVASLIAHEAAHIILNHFDRINLADRQREVGAMAVKTAVLSSSLRHTKFDKNTNKFISTTDDVTKTGTVQKAVIANEAYNFVSTDLVGSAWSRRQEDEADLLGLDMLVAAGYSRNGATGGLRILKEAYRERELFVDQLSSQTDDLEAALAADPSLQNLESVGIELGTRIGEALWKDMKTWVQRSHLDPEDRLENINAYVRREHRAARESSREDRLEANKKAANFDQLWERYTAVQRAYVMMTQNDFQGAKAEIAKGLKGSAASDPYPREVQAKILGGLGDVRGSLASYGKVRDGSIFSISGYVDKAGKELSIGQAKTALRTLETGEGHFGAELFYPLKISAYSSLGQKDQVTQTAELCSKSSLSTIREECRVSLAQVPAELGGQEGAPEAGEGGLLNALSGAGDSLSDVKLPSLFD